MTTVDTMQTNELEVLKNKYRILRRFLRQRIIQIAKQVNRDNLNSDFVDCAKCPFQADFLDIVARSEATTPTTKTTLCSNKAGCLCFEYFCHERKSCKHGVSKFKFIHKTLEELLILEHYSKKWLLQTPKDIPSILIRKLRLQWCWTCNPTIQDYLKNGYDWRENEDKDLPEPESECECDNESTISDCKMNVD